MITFAILNCAVAQSGVDLGPNEIPAGDQRLDIGVGYNTLTGEVKQTKCVSVKLRPDENFDENLLQQAVEMEPGNSFETLSKRDSTRARASVKYGGFKASATYQAMSSAKVSAYTEYLKIIGRIRFFRQIGFKNDVKILESNGENFYEKCGNAFIIGVIKGHDFTATYQSEASNRK